MDYFSYFIYAEKYNADFKVISYQFMFRSQNIEESWFKS